VSIIFCAPVSFSAKTIIQAKTQGLTKSWLLRFRSQYRAARWIIPATVSGQEPKTLSESCPKKVLDKEP